MTEYPSRRHYRPRTAGAGSGAGQQGPAGNEFNPLSFQFSGLDYSNQTLQIAPGTGALTANVLRTFPLVITKAVTYTALRVQVSTAVAATNFRIGLYNSNAAGYPNQLIAGSDTLSFDGNLTTVQVGTFASAITLQPGLYWIAVISSGAPTLRSVPVAAIPPVLGFNPAFGTNNQYTGRSIARTFGPLPDPHPAGATLLANTVAPLVLLRVQ
jgi:hypothetical protein